MTKTLILIGEPGAGKTTLIKELTDSWTELTREINPIKHITYKTPYGPAIQLGWTRAPFGGTDSLPQAVITQVAQWYQEGIEGLVIAEGDRLANDRFIKIAQDHGETLIFHLNTDPVEAQTRRILRSRAHNLPAQNLSWLKGRQTKHLNLAERHGAIKLDGSLSPQTLADQIRYYLS